MRILDLGSSGPSQSDVRVTQVTFDELDFVVQEKSIRLDLLTEIYIALSRTGLIQLETSDGVIDVSLSSDTFFGWTLENQRFGRCTSLLHRDGKLADTTKFITSVYRTSGQDDLLKIHRTLSNPPSPIVVTVIETPSDEMSVLTHLSAMVGYVRLEEEHHLKTARTIGPVPLVGSFRPRLSQVIKHLFD